jgi:hypothetical protein
MRLPRRPSPEELFAMTTEILSVVGKTSLILPLQKGENGCFTLDTTYFYHFPSFVKRG